MKSIKWNKLFVALLLSLISYFFVSQKLLSSYNFDSDFARDLIQILGIAKGRITLIGPQTSFGGLYVGPYYYYLFVPIFFITKYSMGAILYFNAFLYSLAVFYFFYRIYVKHSFLTSLLASATLLTSNVFIYSSRNPGNAFSYLPFLLFFLTYVSFSKIKYWYQGLLLGFVFGLILNFHYSNAILVPFTLLFFIKNRRVFISYLLSFFLTFIPLFLFELRHGFIMLKNTFVTRSFTTFLGNQNLAGAASGKENILENILFMNSEMNKWIQPMPLLLLILILFFLLKGKLKFEEKILGITSLGGFLLLSILLRFQFTSFYLFPVALTLLVTLVLFLLKNKYGFLLLFFIFVLNVLTFPTYLYSDAVRPYTKFSQAVKFAIEKNLVGKSGFNILQLRPDTIIAPHGNEYRYYFIKKGYIPDLPHEYNNSTTLLIFSEIPNYTIESLNTWEVQQFGTQHFKNKKIFTSGDVTIFKVDKINPGG
ncbi:hypothetical protein A2866_01555 [Candidatus Roizmanbacteria bacterium RIFCSPHIGHO2_01_FULL_39_8]|uniref:Glycosyltransferase RgtA/B/C/D-like domain-containing protein n=3 Tax=Candidatus Roizmaniibacteriota TaxID=1752723 RepID=A0A1F7GK45_9BACT|nr:MAG: hypothetical protein A2866_01555 [Candidatus Roizmanbacteria bacterium RIFCSPHIGHO2_01_FULL_39_8]OGK27647.1 MAG: hypothetical protein A3C28_04875 [Candidatus Roizmanbacteria bacterium RIFCSPHIGHO2_02_FULL_39_9]OGK38108.1 MAG: hypothetical protein A3F60_00500 [Candidatus Roizmanbacteria bacterium RIFCSPHIGHO2_12_FULL_39_8]